MCLTINGGQFTLNSLFSGPAPYKALLGQNSLIFSCCTLQKVTRSIGYPSMAMGQNVKNLGGTLPFTSTYCGHHQFIIYKRLNFPWHPMNFQPPGRGLQRHADSTGTLGAHLQLLQGTPGLRGRGSTWGHHSLDVSELSDIGKMWGNIWKDHEKLW